MIPVSNDLQVWTEYIEMELRHKNYDLALALAKRATVVPSNYRSIGRNAPVKERYAIYLFVYSDWVLVLIFEDYSNLLVCGLSMLI